MNKYLLAFSLIATLGYSASSQLDIFAEYHRPVFTSWNSTILASSDSESGIFSQMPGAGVAYRYYPFESRIGFIPGLSFSFANEKLGADINRSNYQIFQFGLSVPVQVFPFDLQGDCNCPTFGRQHDFFQKSLFFKFIPEIAYQLLELQASTTSEKANALVFSFGAGLGMNIALSELLTIAPEISYHRILLEKWDGFSTWHQSEGSDKTDAMKWSFGLRFSFYLAN